MKHCAEKKIIYTKLNRIRGVERRWQRNAFLYILYFYTLFGV